MERAVFLKFAKIAAIEPKKFADSDQRSFDFEENVFAGNVCKSRGEIGQKPFKCETLVMRGVGRRNSKRFLH
ncbi:hypothetical protein [Bradyrhizobium sp. sGM-13]|uniref:hypothetical protein n=1 Tax=Bradyrhizobium sp. sGM-13 TaxID=2831781 RepID=UPI001BCE1A52|nr:hypothetical protein [Bradyrhizobium sp. sGM-13]